MNKMSSDEKASPKKILGLIGIYIAIYAVCTALFIALFHTPILV